MKIYIVMITMLISVSAFAEKVIIANCSEGGGCTFELSDFESELFDSDFGRPIQSDDIIVLGRKKNGKEVLYLDKKSRAAIDKQWGGDGYTQLGLFNPAIQPLNGLWKADYGTSTGNDCYGIDNVGTFIRKHRSAGSAGSGNIKFQFPFSPSQLFPSSDMRWVKTGYNTYKGILDLGSSKLSGIKMYYNITIVSNRKIETYYTVEIKVPTKETCIGKIPVTFTLVNADEPEDPFGNNEPNEDDLLPVNPNEDDLLPVEPGKNSKPNVPRIETDVERIEDEGDLLPVNPKKDNLLPVEPGKKPKTTVRRIEDKTNIPRIEDKPKSNIPRIEDKPKPNVPRLEN